MKVLSYLFIALSITAILLSCLRKPDEPDPCQGLDEPMPEASTNGANIMGCYINGEPWVAYKGEPGLLPIGQGKIDLDYISPSDFITVSAQRDIVHPDCNTPVDERFKLFVFDIHEVSSKLSESSYFGNYQSGCRFYVDTSAANIVTITNFDEENRIISFNFECYLISQDCPNADTLHVTEGRFDAYYL